MEESEERAAFDVVEEPLVASLDEESVLDNTEGPNPSASSANNGEGALSSNSDLDEASPKLGRLYSFFLPPP